MNVKTVHSQSPEKFLEDTIKDFPDGTCIVMETKNGKHTSEPNMCWLQLQ